MKMPATTHSKLEVVKPSPVSDVGDAAKQCLNCLEKKVRNLEKRKGRIEQNQEKAKKGTKLEKEQENSLQQYEQVTHDLEFARELHKQFLQINQEHEKMMKKQAKRDKAERQVLEIKRVSEILQLQSLLDAMGGDRVREDFKTGKHGAVVLTEDNLSQLDELYQAISPSRDDSGAEYPQRITLAAEHLVNVLEGKDRHVVGTTYKELKALITLINECGYFERAKKATTEEVATEPSEELEQQEETAEDPASSEVDTEELHQNGEDHQQQQPMDLTVGAADGAHTHQEMPLQSAHSLEQDSFFTPNEPSYKSEDESQFNQAAQVPASRVPDFQSFTNNRPFQFIQASYIMPESTAAGLADPAVIAAQPAGATSLQFLSQGYDSSSSQVLLPQVGLQQQPTIQPGNSSSAADLKHQLHPTSVSQEYNPQNFIQSSLQSADGRFSAQSVAEMGGSVSSHPGKVVQLHENTRASYEVPPTIPMPPSQSQEQNFDQLQPHLQEKKFQMNASAPVFQSMYAQGMQGPDQAGPTQSADSLASSEDYSGTSAPAAGFEPAEAGDSSDQDSAGGFQKVYHANSGYPGGNFQRGSRGGYRGPRGGGPNGNGGSRNGAAAGGGDSIQNGFVGRGGANASAGRGGRGGSFQNYNSYRGGDQFQTNYNGGSGFSGGIYPKRGGAANNGAAPASGGFSRGAPAGRSGTGARGGLVRGGGGVGSNGTRGSARVGVFTRPMPAQ